MIETQGKKFNIVGIIPARGGSKGVPRKNIRLLAGQPLIAYSINNSKKSKYLDKIVVSTEDKEISQIAEKFGAQVVPRPAELATDSAPTEPCLIQVIGELEKKENFKTDIVVLLQATTPFRLAADIDAAIEKIVSQDKADSLYSVYPAPHLFNPYWISRIDGDGFVRPFLGDKLNTNRQSLPQAYWRDGQIYMTYADALIKTGSRFGEKGTIPYVNTRDKYHINIDDELDFLLAELLVTRGLVNIK